FRPPRGGAARARPATRRSVILPQTPAARLCGCLRPQQDLAHDLAVGDGLEGGCDLRQRIDRVHVRTELALAAPAHDVVHQRLLRLWLALRPCAPDDAADVATLEQHEIEWELRNLPRGEADDEVAAFPAERAHRRLCVRPA